ncbi:MAG TPA: zf-HC2 domain-containing protein [Acidimicrobiales bacterium]|nr:zf-HC2 domain-containing protein [Acidimicrobiales bacterium]
MITLDCRTVVELASDYVDRDLDPDDQDRVAAHLGGCDGCERYVDQVRQTVRLVGRLRRPYPGGERSR